MYNKTIIRFGFCDIQNQGLGKVYQLQLITLTSTLIILDITKTSLFILSTKQLSRQSSVHSWSVYQCLAFKETSKAVLLVISLEYFPFAATKEELYKKGPIVIKLEEYLRAIAQSPVSCYLFLIAMKDKTSKTFLLVIQEK